MRMGPRQAFLAPPVWMRPELYYTDDAVGPFPRIADARLNIVVGTDVVGNEIPGNVIKFPLAAGRNGHAGTGQSTSLGFRCQPGDGVSGASYDLKMFNGGLKAGPAGNVYNVTLIGQTSLVELAESDNSAYGDAGEGETFHTTVLVGLADDMLANSGVALLNNKWVTSCNGKSGTSLGTRVKGALNYFFLEDSIKAQARLTGAGYAMWLFSNFDQENDAVGATPRAVFYDWLDTGLARPVHALARTLSNQKTPVRLLVWQNARGILLSTGAVLAAYDFVVGHPLGAGFGPNWMFERHLDDLVHFTKAGELAYAEYYRRAMGQIVDEGRRPDMITLDSTRYEDGVIKTVFGGVPTPPLVIDNVTYGGAQQEGIRAFPVVDDGLGDFTLTNIEAHGSEIWATPNRPPAGKHTVNVGLDYAVTGGTFPRPVNAGAMCNICDSTPSMPYWVPHYYVTST